MAIEQQRHKADRYRTTQLKSRLAALKPREKVGARERLFFTEQLSLLLSTGTNLHTSLQTLNAQISNPTLRLVVNQMLEDVSEGRQFSKALAKHPEIFSQTYINLIAASEDGGYMHEVLDQLVGMEERRDQLQRTVFSAFAYPVFLLVFAFAVVVFVLVVVFPKFTNLFTMIEDQLPTTTVWLMALSDIFRHHWAYLLIGAIVLYLSIRYWATSEFGRERLDWAKLNLPWVRNFFIPLYILQFLRVMSLSLKNGVNVLEALHASKEVVRNELFRQFILSVEMRVEKGDGISAGFRHIHYIPAIVQQMVTTGEETGKLPKVMSKLSNHYERELVARLQLVSRLIEPVMLLVMGLIVGLLVSSLILPIFKLSRAVG